MSVFSQTTDLDQPSATERGPGSRASRRARGAWRLCSTALVALCLAGCATHRQDPPQCKGPFTPINPTAAVVSHGP